VVDIMNNRKILVAVAAIAIAALIYIRWNKKAMQDGTSNTMSPITTKISPEQKLALSLDPHKGGSAGRKAQVAMARLDPMKEVSPDGRIWTITYDKKKGYQVAGQYFPTLKEAKQRVRSFG
jgi:hypothetical protein